MEQMLGTSGEKDGVVVRSKVAMSRALIVCRHNLRREHVAIYPYSEQDDYSNIDEHRMENLTVDSLIAT